MSQLIIFPDAEALLSAGFELMLPEILPGPAIPIHQDVPNPRPPEEFLIVRRIGGTRRDLVTDLPTILIEGWAKRHSRAERITQAARSILHWFTDINGHFIYVDGEFGGPVNYPDQLSGTPRYTSTYSVAIRAREAITPPERG